MAVTWKASVVGLALVACACGAGEDNATKLAYALERAAAGATGEATVRYAPVNGGTSPYRVMFLPDRPVAEAEFIAAGVDETTVRQMYSDLAYLGEMQNRLIVVQDGERLTFTSSWRQHASVRDLVVSPRKTGDSEVVLHRRGDATWVVAVR